MRPAKKCRARPTSSVTQSSDHDTSKDAISINDDESQEHTAGAPSMPVEPAGPPQMMDPDVLRTFSGKDPSAWLPILKRREVDADATEQLVLLAQLDFAAASEIAFKLTKGRENEIQNPSAFVSKCVSAARKELSTSKWSQKSWSSWDRW